MSITRTMTVAPDCTVAITKGVDGEVVCKGSWGLEGTTMELRYPGTTLKATRIGTSLLVRDSCCSPDPSTATCVHHPVETSDTTIRQPQHFLSFLPEPHGHGSFRPVLLARCTKGLTLLPEAGPSA